MTIKPGTLCIVVYARPQWRHLVGGLCTIVSGDANEYKATLVRPLTKTKRVTGSRRCFLPLNDPDNAPADPSYTRRKTHA